MSKRLLTIIKSAAVTALLLCCVSASAYADKKQEMYDQAMKAGGAGRVEEAAKLLCDLAAIDPKFNDSKTLCTMYTHEAELERKRSDDRFAEGQRLFQDGKFEDAEQKFKNVRAGAHMDEAKQYVSTKIPAAKAEIQGDKAKFDRGMEAYRNGDFTNAKSQLAQVSGKQAQEAQGVLENIKRYEELMSAGDSAMVSKDWTKAAASYSAAAVIKADGPGDPRAKLASAQKASKEPIPAPPPTIIVEKAKSPVAPNKPAVDVSRFLREAISAQASRDYRLAASKYMAVLAAEPTNAVAMRGLESLPGDSKQSEADARLVDAIGEFYHGFYEDSEAHIKDYLRFKGKRTALSNFYLGANQLTRYYLAGARESDKKLLADAKTYFQLARGTAGFAPPDQSVISPKILKVYSGEGQ
jgi:hypothetical protein